MFENLYPDVLGMITGGVRYGQDALQYAAGIYPRGVAIGQPFEVMMVLQSTIDQPQEVAISLQLPRKDASGKKMNFELPRKQFKLKMEAGEVGILHVPVIPLAPTPTAKGYPLTINVKTQSVRRANVMRTDKLGRPPSALAVSPFRLEVLREVTFSGTMQGNDLRCRFDIIPGQLKMDDMSAQPKYEVLWTADQFDADMAAMEQQVEEAKLFAGEFVRSEILEHIEETTQERFSQAGLPLHPAEVMFIAKPITYIFDEAVQFERHYTWDASKWFQWLCSAMVKNPGLTRYDIPTLAAGELYEGALYDAIWVNLPMIQQAVKKRYGSRESHRDYAVKVVQALQGNTPMDLSYAYLPLVMAGVQLNMRVTRRDENLWDSLEELEEAMRGRERLSTSTNSEILKTVEILISSARDRMRRSRVPRD